MDTTLDNSPRFADYIRPVWQRKWLVLLVVIVATGATYVYTKRQPNLYETGTLVFYQPPTNPLNGGAAFSTDRSVGDVAALLYAEDNAVAVAHQIGYPGAPDQLLAQVSVEPAPARTFVAISGSSTDPRQAAAIVMGYAQRLVSVTNTAQRATINGTDSRSQKSAVRDRKVGAGGSHAARADDPDCRSPNCPPDPHRHATGQSGCGAVYAFLPEAAKGHDLRFRAQPRLGCGGCVRPGAVRSGGISGPEDLAAMRLPLLGALPMPSESGPAATMASFASVPSFQEAFGRVANQIELLASLDARRAPIDDAASALPGRGSRTAGTQPRDHVG